jgi:glycine hydroxymethyltransferase
MKTIGKWITEALNHRNDPQALARIKGQVLEMAEKFPLYSWRRVAETVSAR